MILGQLDNSKSFEVLRLFQPNIWQLAFETLKGLSRESTVGITELLGPRMLVNVHTYRTKSLEECRFESHRNTVDIQYVISGGEIVQWAPTESLHTAGTYDATKDLQFHESLATPLFSHSHLTAGRFAIFFPCDAHRPQIQDGQSSAVLKAVIKIDSSLLEHHIDKL